MPQMTAPAADPVAEPTVVSPAADLAPSAPEVRPVSMPLVDRVASAVVTALPPILLAVGIALGWGGKLVDWQDLVNLAVCYVVIGSGITVGYHRLLHPPQLQDLAARCGSCSRCSARWLPRAR